MSGLGENVAARVAYKQYASGDITPNALAVSGTDLGSSGGQILRRTTCTLELTKDTFQSSEIRSDRQIGDYRHGARRASGSISGEWSPGTYFDLIEAAMRGTRVAAVTASEADFTSVAADNATSKFTFGGGNPVTKGFRVGMTIRFTGMSVAANNAKNFIIVAFGGSNNRDVTVFPAPTDQTADTAFNVASIGKSVIIPSSGHVRRKFAFEVYHQDQDVYRLFTECRMSGIKAALPTNGMATIELPVMGRDMESGSGAFFSSPAAATTTGITAGANGLLMLGGSAIGVVTGFNFDLNIPAEAPAVVGQKFAPEIFLGRAPVTGQLTALFEDMTLVNYFINESELSLLSWLTTSEDNAADTISIFMPRLKLTQATVGLQGDAGIPVTMPFQALKYEGSGAGIEQTTLQICDTQAS
jgi:hypothetical protein